MSDFPLTRKARLYRRLLGLILPRRFHARYAHQMLDVFAEVDAGERQTRGTLAAWRALAGELPGLFRLAAIERRSEAPRPSTRSSSESLSRNRLFVRRGLFDEDQAQGMLQWPHSGFQVHAGVGVPEDDRAFALRLARYCARNPLALERQSLRRRASRSPTAPTRSRDPRPVPRRWSRWSSWPAWSPTFPIPAR